MQADSIVVELHFDNGISGYGESAPRPYVTGEMPSIVTKTIKNLFPAILFENGITSLKDKQKTLDALEKKRRDENLAPYNPAIGAIDIAHLRCCCEAGRQVPL